MHVDTVIRLTAPAAAIDFDGGGAAMHFAWYHTAQALWSARQFNTDHRALFAAELRAAHAHVSQVRLRRAKALRAEADPQVTSLRAQRDELRFLPAHMQTGSMINQIDAQISALVDSM